MPVSTKELNKQQKLNKQRALEYKRWVDEQQHLREQALMTSKEIEKQEALEDVRERQTHEELLKKQKALEEQREKKTQIELEERRKQRELEEQRKQKELEAQRALWKHRFKDLDFMAALEQTKKFSKVPMKIQYHNMVSPAALLPSPPASDHDPATPSYHSMHRNPDILPHHGAELATPPPTP
jgi:hypothetical protein